MPDTTDHAAEIVEVGGRAVTVSNPDKVLWPRAGFTKRDFVHYYLDVAPALLPHARGRPLTLRRAPDGVEAEWWYQQQCPHPPDWMHTQEVPGARPPKVWRYCVAEDAAALAWLANLGCIELHPLLFRDGDTDTALEVVFDLDPGPSAGLVDCCEVALRLRDLFEALGLRGYVKSSGSLGLHVHLPLGPGHPFETTKRFARETAARLVREHPAKVVDHPERRARVGKVLVDWRQNDTYKSLVAPYCLRLAPHPTAAVPLSWEEIEAAADRASPEGLLFLADDALRRLRAVGDLLADVDSTGQRLP